MWDLTITDIKIGTVVIAFTWTAVGLMCLNLSLWTQVLVSGLEEDCGSKFAWNSWSRTDREVGKMEGQNMELNSGREV
jgi:hypothetical protein